MTGLAGQAKRFGIFKRDIRLFVLRELHELNNSGLRLEFLSDSHQDNGMHIFGRSRQGTIQVPASTIVAE
jgi:hypothetical protein